MSEGDRIASREHARNSILLVLLHHFIFDLPDGTTVGEIVKTVLDDPHPVRAGDAGKLLEPYTNILKTMLAGGGPPLDFTISNQSWKMGYDRDGLNACTYTDPAAGEVYFAFRGTGDGEWNDNGAALCGVKQPNVYYTYNSRDEATGAEIREDLLSTQQVQTLDYIERALLRGGWKGRRGLIVCGHSKGGNKAQLAALFRDEFAEGYSFNGQGFSPEAVEWFKERFPDYGERVSKIYSICCCDDFVSGLGDSLAPTENLETVSANPEKTLRACHELYTMIAENLEINPSAPRSRLGESTVKLWEAVRESPDRPLAAMGLMNTCEKSYGSGLPVNGEYVTGGVEALGGLISAGMYIKANAEEVKPLKRAVDGVAVLIDKLAGAAEQFGLSRERIRADFEASYGSSPHPSTSLNPAALRERAASLDAAAQALTAAANELKGYKQAQGDRETALTQAARLKVISAAARAALHDFESVDGGLARLAGLSLKGAGKIL